MPIYAQYYFWLVGVSLFCVLLERIRPWRKDQRVLRKGWMQDVFWLVFNGHYLGILMAIGTGRLVALFNGWLGAQGWPTPDSLQLAADWPVAVQFVVFFLVKDFVEWNIHRLLHNVPFLWEFHKLHHSIEELDWIGNFRFHWGEIVVYKTLSYLPLVIFGVDPTVILVIAVIGTLMQDLNHANVRISWGPLRYVLNSARMHVWHHDVELHGKGGQNFGIVLSVWDWIFRTAYWPDGEEGPARLGFAGQQETYPEGLAGRFFYPLWRPRRPYQTGS